MWIHYRTCVGLCQDPWDGKAMFGAHAGNDRIPRKQYEGLSDTLCWITLLLTFWAQSADGRRVGEDGASSAGSSGAGVART